MNSINLMFSFLGFTCCANRHVSYYKTVREWFDLVRGDFKLHHETEIGGFPAQAHFPPDICLKEVNEMLLGNKAAGWECHENGWRSEKKSENMSQWQGNRCSLQATFPNPGKIHESFGKQNVWSYIWLHFTDHGSYGEYFKLFCV